MATALLGQGTGAKEFLLRVDSFHGQVEWEQSIDRVNWTAVANGNVATLKLTPTQTTLYRARITAPGCAPIYSNVKGAVFTSQGMVGARMVEGMVTLPEGAAVTAKELSVLSFLEESSLRADGSFQVLVPDSVEEDVLLVMNSQEQVLMLGHYVGKHEQYAVTSETTASALLTMYPALKPLPVAEKPGYMELYRKEPEYQTLVSQVTALNKQGFDLFSEQNIGLIKTLGALAQKTFNKDRLQVMATGAVYIRSAQTSAVNIANIADFSYSGRVYRTADGVPISPVFNVAGKTIRGSSLAQQIIRLMRGSAVNVKSDEVTIDLKKEFNATPGEYEIRIRSGLALDGSPEDDEAMIQNMYEWISLMLANYTGFPDVFGECIANVINAELNAINPHNLKDAIVQKKAFELYILPILKEVGKSAATCSQEAAGKAPSKLFKMVDLVDKHLPVFWYAGEWGIREAAVDGCQYLNADYETSNCFYIESAKTINKQYFPGDTVEIKIKAVENEHYYPYEVKEAAFRRFTWLKKGGSYFSKPERVDLFYDRTDVNGEATIKWVLSCEEEVNTVQAWIQGVEESLKDNMFYTLTRVPPMEVVKQEGSDYQEGEKGKKLPRPIVFSIRDLSDNLPVKLNRFNLKWEVLSNNTWVPVAGTGVISDSPNNTNPLFMVSKEWTLANLEGPQKVRATLEDKCGKKWQVAGNPVVFSTGRNPWIDSLAGKWTYEIYTTFREVNHYKSLESSWEASKDLNPCYFHYKPIGNNTVHWTEFAKVTYELFDDLKMTKVREQAKSGQDCTLETQNYVGRWSITGNGYISVSLIGNIGGKEITVTDQELWGQLERIDDNTYKVHIARCISEWDNCFSYGILRRQ
ncbi:hypothetical protein GCM10027293_33340 [Pontibacter aydingkolensis]